MPAEVPQSQQQQEARVQEQFKQLWTELRALKQDREQFSDAGSANGSTTSARPRGGDGWIPLNRRTKLIVGGFREDTRKVDVERFIRLALRGHGD